MKVKQQKKTLDFVDNFAYENGYWCEPNKIDINAIKIYVVVQIMLNMDCFIVYIYCFELVRFSKIFIHYHLQFNICLH